MATAAPVLSPDSWLVKTVRGRLVLLACAVGVIHLAAALLFWGGRGGVLTFGLLLTAYLAGVKHSYDWDHLAAIDNSTRKFVSEGRRPVSVGFAFSLGHSTVVALAGALLVAGVHAVQGAIEEGNASNHVLGLIGAGVSGLYLLAMGLFNARAALSVGRTLRSAHAGETVREEDLRARGVVARLIEAPLRHVRKPWHIYVVGFLFGLGFDTASTVALLILTVSASAAGVSPLALLSLPAAFTAAMTLCDSLNGAAMMRLYDTALREPMRRLRFNLVITALSAVSALMISFITLGGWLRELLGLEDPVTGWLADVDLGDAGLLLAGSFLVIWLVWRLAQRPGQGRTAQPNPGS